MAHCAALGRLAEGNRLCLMVDCTPVYLAEIQAARTRIPWNAIREIRCVRTSAGVPPAHAVDVCWDLACHDLAVVHFWLGRLPLMVRRASASGDGVTLQGRFPGGPAVEIAVGYESRSLRSITVSSDRRQWIFRQRQTRPEPLQSVLAHFTECTLTGAGPITGIECATETARVLAGTPAGVTDLRDSQPRR